MASSDYESMSRFHQHLSKIPMYELIHIAVNTIVLILGIIVAVSVFVVLGEIPPQVDDLLPSSRITLTFLPIMSLALLIFIVMGLSAVRTRRAVLLSCQAIFATILGLLFVVNSAFLLIFVEDITEGVYFKEKFRDLASRYLNEEALSVHRKIDIIQSQYECCGSESYHDWIILKEKNRGVYPESCCEHKESDRLAPVECREMNIYREGCAQKVRASIQAGCWTAAICGLILSFVLFVHSFWSWFLMKVFEDDLSENLKHRVLWLRRPYGARSEERRHGHDLNELESTDVRDEYPLEEVPLDESTEEEQPRFSFGRFFRRH